MDRSARTRASRILVVLALALTVSGLAAASSNAAVTLGSDLSAESTGTVGCTISTETTRGCFLVNKVIPGRELTAPFNGVIVRWHLRLGSQTDAQSIRIRVVRPITAENFKIISSGPLESVPKGAGTYEFPAALPIAAGDQVGLENEAGKIIGLPVVLSGAESFMFIMNKMSALDGSETGPPYEAIKDLEWNFNVEVEPDCDHDGLGDETQDTDTSTCTTPPPAVSTGPPQTPAQCAVPKLKGRTLKAAKKRARKANCGIGHVKKREGVTAKTGKVVKQKPKPGKVKPAGSKIAVTLG